MHASYSTRKAARTIEEADISEMTNYDIMIMETTKAVPFKHSNYFLLIECLEYQTRRTELVLLSHAIVMD